MTKMPQRVARLAIQALLLAAVALGSTAYAQQEPEVDPPGRVARLSELDGQVWLYNPDSGEWVTAARNRPLTTGDRLATESNGRAELQIGSTTVRIDAGSELEVVQLDDDHVALELHEGSALAQVRDLAGAGQFELTTEEGRFVALATGTYRFDRRDGRSDVSVYRGQARYEGPNSGLAVGAGQRAEFWIDSGGVAQYSTSAPVNDAFLAWSSDRDRRFAGAVTERYVSPEMTGAAELDAYGRWEQNPDYGSVWIPTAVAADWAPYSRGHWTWVRPWGWTWVDDAPWGFAPFHYGRWVYARNTWCWTPGTRVARPVYAPALVAWVGGPRGNVSVQVGGGPAVGWFPLAPREVYVPSYRVSPRYARNINFSNVGNVTIINNVFANPQGPREFWNRGAPRAITVVPSNVMAERRPVGPASAQFRQAPWVRDIANDRGRTVAMIAPPVAAPPLAPRRDDSRGVRPPPGFAPNAGDRPGFGNRNPGQRDGDRERGGDGRAPSPNAQARDPDRGGFVPTPRPPGFPAERPGTRNERPGGFPAERPGGFPPERAGGFPAERGPSQRGNPPPVVQQPAAPAVVQPGALPPAVNGRPQQPNEPGLRRPDSPATIPPAPGRFQRDPDREPRERPGFGAPRERGIDAPRERGIEAPRAPTAPNVIAPTAQPPRPAIAPPPQQEAPMMRAQPIRRGGDEERRPDERRAAPPQAPQAQPQTQAPQQAASPRFERPPMQPAAPPRVEMPRPAAPVAIPQQQAPQQRNEPRNEPRGPDQRRGGDGRDTR